MAFNSLRTSNLPDPAIDPAQNKEPRDYFETFIYTGNGGGLQVGDVIKKPADTTTISSSLIFNDDDSAYLSKTFGNGDSGTTYTLSCWFKVGSNIGTTTRPLFAAGSAATWDMLYISSGDVISFSQATEVTSNFRSNAKVKDSSKWYHIVLVVNTAGSTPYVKAYLDGVQLTWSTESQPSASATSQIGTSTNYYIGRNTAGSAHFDGYMAEYHFVDGTAHAPTDFGNFDANGIWIPKAVTGITYGTNGFYLDFADNTSTTTLGADQTANGNDWTLNNLATTDQVADSPTNNCALHLNPSTATTHTISEGNLKTTNTSGTHGGAVCNRAYFSGKWYHEVKILAETSDKGQGVGIGNRVTRTTTDWGNYTNIVAYMSDGTVHKAGGYSAFGTAHNTNDIIGVAYDHDARTIEFFHNGTSQGTLTESDFQSTIDWDNIAPLVFGRNVTQELNFGQRTLVHTPPTGYVTMTENNITVDDQNLESPDFVWIKNRDQADQHHLYDSVRGIQKAIYSSANTIETAEPNSLLDFNKNGFTIGSEVEVNTANEDYVAWCWKTGTSFSYSGETGTIDSVGSVNTDSGFSIVTYTGSSVANEERVKHGLSSAPEMIMVKNLSGADSWAVYHKDLAINNFLELNFNYGQASGSNPRFLSGDYGTSTPTSTYFYVRNYAGSTTNDNGDNYVAYCFHSVDGFSKFDRYVGNGSADGTFVYTGFRPAFVMVKRYNTTGNWLMYDSKVDGYNVMYQRLYANLNLADGASGADIDFVSNGFKHRRLEADQNASNSTYIYMAFAETPFKYATAR